VGAGERTEALPGSTETSSVSQTRSPHPLLVSLHQIHKCFGTTQALAGAELELRQGEVHALLGENGAGKTTLVRILYGMLQPDSGRIELDGRLVEFTGPRAALERGIALVHQHFMLVPALTVAENLCLGDPGLGWFSPDEQLRIARERLGAFDLALDPSARAGDLGVAQQQQLEIARALVRGVRLLILDEPTAVLAPSEVTSLLGWLDRLRSQGCSVLFISHKLGEVVQVADRVTVLRSGRTIGTQQVGSLQPDELARWMVGREVEGLEPLTLPDVEAPLALRVHEGVADGLNGVQLELRRGELLALAGIDGNGQGPLEEVFAGVRALRSGIVEVLAPPLALISGDRQRTGLVLDLSVEENLVLPDTGASVGDSALFRHAWLAGGVIAREEMRARAERALEPFGLRGTLDARVRGLSGGNQQKVCVARALRGDPGVIVAVNPTRGLDVEAAQAVRRALLDRARAGAGVLLISTDLDEVLELGTRIAVLFRGRVVALAEGERSREAIGARMLGQGAE